MNLFTPITLGAIHAPNRIFMSPLTRGRGTHEHVPTPLMAEYYTQRASAGLIITEATGISLEGLGWPYAPGIWNDEQVAGWRVVTDSVHRAGGRIALQLWHMGRLVHPSMPGRGQPVSASATTAPGETSTYEGKQANVPARALELAEIPRIIADYEHAARNAIAAGFDGVELHAANGYLIDQFLRNSSNLRTDEYGGSIENRTRLLVEVTRAIVKIVGADRVGVRLSPNGEIQGVNDSHPEPLFTLAASRLGQIGIAFLEVREPPPDSTRGKPDVPPIAPAMRRAFSGRFVLNSEFNGPRAQAALDRGDADAITFGRTFLANPDLPRKIAEHIELTPADPETFYTQGPHGYTDYPTV